MKKTVFITGASSGIGKATAIYFANQGWNVAATMRSPEKDTEFKDYPTVKLYRLDVTDPLSIEAAVEAAYRDFGRVDAVVNNAGYGVDGVFEAMTDDIIQKQFDTNVFGLMRVTRAFIPKFRAQGGGTIIQITSVGGQVTFPLYSIYHGTKWAVEGFSESLHYELRPFNIRVRIVEPGAIKTDFYTRNRVFVKPTNTNDYDAFVEKCEKLAMETGEKGASPDKVATVIMKAATDSGWRLRYPTAYPAPFIIWLKRWLPNSWFFAFVRSSFKI